jgi:hypothetical protein
VSRTNTEIERCLQGVAAIRIGYGVLALLTPNLLARLMGLRPGPDLRLVNAYLGSRDIAIGVHSLLATKHDQQREAVLVNETCEVCDTLLLAQEFRRGRPLGPVIAFLCAFNASQHLLWAWALKVLSR